VTEVRERRWRVRRHQARTRPVFSARSKRRDGNRGVEFTDRFDDPEQGRRARLQLTSREVQRVRVHEQEHVQTLQQRADELARGERIATHPSCDPAEPPEGDEICLQRSGDRRSVVGADLFQRASRGEQRAHLSKPRDLSADSAPRGKANPEIHDEAKHDHKQQFRPDERK
jgi:hypothetical protein